MREVRANLLSGVQRASADAAEIEKRQEWEKCVAQCVRERTDPRDELVCARICV
jgi:hypothetical protein